MSYLTSYLNGPSIQVVCTLAEEKLRGVDFDTIAVRGVSGLLVGAPLSVSLAKELVVIRKDEETSHGSPVEGTPSGKVLIVDDFIDSGATIEAIYTKLRRYECELIGVLLYSSNRKAKSYAINTYKKRIPLFNLPPPKLKHTQ